MIPSITQKNSPIAKRNGQVTVKKSVMGGNSKKAIMAKQTAATVL